MEKVGREVKMYFLRKIQGLIVSLYAQKMDKTMQIQGQIKWLLDEFA